MQHQLAQGVADGGRLGMIGRNSRQRDRPVEPLLQIGLDVCRQWQQPVGDHSRSPQLPGPQRFAAQQRLPGPPERIEQFRCQRVVGRRDQSQCLGPHVGAPLRVGNEGQHHLGGGGLVDVGRGGPRQHLAGRQRRQEQVGGHPSRSEQPVDNRPQIGEPLLGGPLHGGPADLWVAIGEAQFGGVGATGVLASGGQQAGEPPFRRPLSPGQQWGQQLLAREMAGQRLDQGGEDRRVIDREGQRHELPVFQVRARQRGEQGRLIGLGGPATQAFVQEQPREFSRERGLGRK